MAKTRRRFATNAMDDQDEDAFLLGPFAEGGQERRKGQRVERSENWLPILCGLIMALVFLLTFSFYLVFPSSPSGLRLPKPSTCDTIGQGYQCEPDISHIWGQYSPYFKVPSEISPAVPENCTVTLAQLISRHGARYPTRHKSKFYAKTISRIQSEARNLTGAYAFLSKYTYDLGANDLTDFGQQEMVNSGIQFFTTYPALSSTSTPFIRASGSQRVIESAQNFSRGFHRAKIASGATTDPAYPYPILTLSESKKSNNTLSPPHTLCPAFSPHPGPTAQKTFLATFLPPLQTRLSTALGLSLSGPETLSLLDLCPFTTVASPFPSSPTQTSFCALFFPQDFTSYNYYQTLGKHYGYGAGNPLGPTLGVGYVNELIARLTRSQVNDHTSVNHTLDSDPATFPLFDRGGIYADFGHDNGMASIFAAMELFPKTPELDLGRVMDLEELMGYSAATTVPFGGRAVVERMTCAVPSSSPQTSKRGEGEAEQPETETETEMIRVIMNGRVLPLEWCGGDGEGRCGLGAFVEGLAFARRGGEWEECFSHDAQTVEVGGGGEGGDDMTTE